MRAYVALLVGVLVGGGIALGGEAAGRPAGTAVQTGNGRLSADAAGLASRISQVVKITPDQVPVLREIVREYGQKVDAYRKDREQRVGSVFSLPTAQMKRQVTIDDETYMRLEDETYSRVEAEVLNEAQLPLLQAYRLYYRATAPLNWVQVTRPQADKVKAQADAMVKLAAGPGTSEEVYQRRLASLKQWIKQEVLTPEQLTKLTELEREREGYLKETKP